jgi:hypothetical protein
MNYMKGIIAKMMTSKNLSVEFSTISVFAQYVFSDYPGFKLKGLTGRYSIFCNLNISHTIQKIYVRSPGMNK